MKNFLLSFFMLCCFWGFAQEKTITGVVSDDQNMPLPGATVLVKGTSNGTQTDFDGNYTIEANTGDTLVFSYVGMDSKEVVVGSSSTINAALSVSTNELDEVVVVGYGTQKKEDVTGAISVVSGEEIAKQPNANAVSSIQGKVPGVNITNSGRPGASPNVRIRGVGSVSNSDPLYVVDGVLTNDISYLNSSDIESMNILKDASSSAIYGIRAANGVIVIKTKKGTGRDEKPKLTYDGFVGMQTVANTLEMANASEYVEMYNEKQVFEGSNNFLNVADFDADTDWFDEITKDAALTTSHNISVTGSSEKTRYYLGFGYFGQDGILDAGQNINSGNDFRRLTARAGLDVDVKDYLTIGGSIVYTDTQNNNSNEPFYQAFIAPPIFNPINPDGTYGEPTGVGNFANPRASLDFRRSKGKSNRVLTNVYAQLEPVKDLTFKISFSGDYSNGRDFNYTPVYRVSPSQGSDISTLVRNSFENDNWLWENTLTWSKSIDKHNFTLLGGFSQEERISFGMEGIADDVAYNGDDSSLYLGLGNADTEEVDDRGSKVRYQSFFGRLQYKFDNKYLLNATLRQDGASNFPSSNNTEIFPSIGLGWIMSNEDFMDYEALTTLKLKASWGRLGNANVPRGFDVTASDPGLTYFGGQAYVSRSISEFSDPSIFWEIVEEYDLGVEVAFFQNQLKGELNYYNRATNDAVFSVTQLGSSGATNTSILTNAGSFLNKGFEFSVSWNKQVSDDFSYGVYGNYTTIDNEVTDVKGSSFLNAGPGLFGNPIIRIEKGAEIGSYYGYLVDGVIQTDEEAAQFGAPKGAFKFQDLNNDGQIGEDDKAFLGSPIPEFTYGFGFNMAYKKIDFAIDFQGVTGNEIYNYNRNARFGNENWDKDFYDNRWTVNNATNSYPTPNSDQSTLRPSSFFVEKGDYFRIRNIQVGYTLPNAKIGSSQLWESFRIYLNAQNPLTLFSYNGFSPEISGEQNDGGVIESGIDRNVYPLFATYNLGFNITF
ncbi:SusC/RagA family TonB-linked outer membrane protein [Galbibacter mesophilus]|uniref:SusC/RagA family TonB-linked outer membrane protein n=1 Tax=Galbibacter mesophilus TaxID=379069 RepID=UPI00191DAC2F|nr:TonB-dependent receptor [Galbibacter mesophilus]MCM5662851.1 TonB-dependent receptor [Galbibacter mesophilus]